MRNKGMAREREKYKYLVSEYLIKLEIQDVKSEYKLKKVLKLLNEVIIKREQNFPIIENLSSWKDLYSYLELVSMHVMASTNNVNVSKNYSYNQQLNLEVNNKEIELDFFQSKEAEFIYYLTKLDGEIQREKLGIKPMHYNKKEYAKKWRNSILKEIHPDKSKHKEAAKAIDALNEIYSKMVK